MREHEEFKHDKYYVVRSGYYYITSLLQLNGIKKFGKVITQGEVTELAKVRNFYKDFDKTEFREKYEKLVENLKRNKKYELIEIDDIKEILSCMEVREVEK